MGPIIRPSSRLVAAVAVAATLGLVSGCSGTENPTVYAYECERQADPVPTTVTSLADALAHQAAVNKAYRQCIDRRGVRAGY